MNTETQQKMDALKAKYAADSAKDMADVTEVYADHVVSEAKGSGAAEMSPDEAIETLEES